jgi:hypothetical protein
MYLDTKTLWGNPAVAYLTSVSLLSVQRMIPIGGLSPSAAKSGTLK